MTNCAMHQIDSIVFLTILLMKILTSVAWYTDEQDDDDTKNVHLRKERADIPELPPSIQEFFKEIYGPGGIEEYIKMVDHDKPKKRKDWRKMKIFQAGPLRDYYDCITKSLETLKYEVPIKAILAFEGQMVKMPCRVCSRPDEEVSAFWQQFRTEDAVMSHVFEDKRIKIDQKMTLYIRQVDIIDAGQYYCIHGNDAQEIYQLDVLFREPHMIIPEDKEELLQPPLILKDHNLKVYNKYAGNWSACTMCGKEGKSQKYGMCIVAKWTLNWPVKPVDVPLMNLYPEGVPCRSTVLPKFIKRLPGIRQRKSEMIVRKCLVPCPSAPPVFTVTDAAGNVIEMAEGGYYPLNQKPTFPPIVKRKVLYEPGGKHLILSCPADTGTDRRKIRWQKGENNINPATVRHLTKGRVWIDKEKRLHFKKLRATDSGHYACWAWRKQIATIKVVTYDAFDPKKQLYITYGGIFLTVILVLCVCICGVCGRKKGRAK